jgi:Flp pilus assembly protein TadG
MKFIDKLLKNQCGVVIVEFALTLPFFIGITVVGLEYSYFALVNMKLNQIAVTAADNASRYTPTMDESDFVDVSAGTTVIGAAIDFNANGRIILSSLQHNGLNGGNAGQVINWQRCNGSLTTVGSRYGVQGAGATNSSLSTGVGSPTNRITAATGTAIMFVEVVFDYQPLIAPNFPGSVQLDRRMRFESAYVVRSRQNFNITNTGNIAVNSC